jgi:competence protein ComGF
MGRFIKRENNGKIYLRESQTQDWILISNQSTVETKVQRKTKQRVSSESLFKLVTV